MRGKEIVIKKANIEKESNLIFFARPEAPAIYTDEDTLTLHDALPFLQEGCAITGCYYILLDGL